MKQCISVLELNTNQLLSVEFENCDIIKNMIQTCYAYPEDYPIVEFQLNDKKFQTWFVGYKSDKTTGNRVFISKNGICITEELKRVKDISTIVWRIRLERDWSELKRD